MLAEALARSMDPSEQKSAFVRDMVQATNESSRTRGRATSTVRPAAAARPPRETSGPAAIPNIPGAIFTGMDMLFFVLYICALPMNLSVLCGILPRKKIKFQKIMKMPKFEVAEKSAFFVLFILY